MTVSPYRDEQVGFQHFEMDVCELCETRKRCIEEHEIVACIDCNDTLLP